MYGKVTGHKLKTAYLRRITSKFGPIWISGSWKEDQNVKEKLEDTKEITRNRKSKKDRQYNSQMKKEKKKDKQ
jgi:hypothetical protein